MGGEGGGLEEVNFFLTRNPNLIGGGVGGEARVSDFFY